MIVYFIENCKNDEKTSRKVKMKPTILVVENDEDVGQLIASYLRGQGYPLFTAVDGADGIRLLENEPCIEIVITDRLMPKKNGLAVLLRSKQLNLTRPVAVLSGNFDVGEPSTEVLSDAGADAFLEKPLKSLDDLLRLIQYLEKKLSPSTAPARHTFAEVLLLIKKVENEKNLNPSFFLEWGRKLRTFRIAFAQELSSEPSLLLSVPGTAILGESANAIFCEMQKLVATSN